jgi:eukaryotic-like serine/threonine-protein kinase
VKRPVDTCDDRRLRVLLRTDADVVAEDSAEFRATAAHLEACPRCQSRLSELAADASHWDETRELLAVSAADAAIETERRERATSGVWHGAAAPAWTEAMAKQLLAPPSHPEMLGRVGRYEVERLIGSGGMGIVFKGFDTELNRPVAIKVLAPHLAGNGAARQRFAREARAAAAVVHEHVVAIHNVESDGAAPFLVMQFVAGDSLQARLDRQGPLALKEILRIGHQTAAGLAAAHAQGLVHRDVKPSNIMLEQGVERALLTDFGLARAADDASLTHTGYLPGTPHYMSPEQARGDAIDGRSDQFSLGSVLYALCTGRPPFRADTSFGVLRRITDTQPRPIREVNPDIPAWLVRLIDRLLAKQPADRFTSAAEVAALLEQCLAHVQQPDSAPLPEVCTECPPGRFALPWPAKLLVATGITAALLFISNAFFALPRHELHNNSNPTPFAAEPQNQIASPADLDWDSAARDIETLAGDVNNLQARADQLWDQQPVPPAAVPAAPLPELPMEPLP